ncbi:MAG: BMP family protein [Thermoleophilia bacterium]
MPRRPLRIAAALAAALSLSLALVACGGDDDAAADSAGTVAATAPAGGDFSVALLNAGSANDGSWGQSTYQGLEEAVDELGITEAGHAENLLTPEEYTQQGSAFAREGVDLVLLANGSVPQSLPQVAKVNPDTIVCEAAVTIPDAELPSNGCAYDPEQQQGAFLAGALAGMTTTTGKVAVVAGFAFPALTRQAEGFILGARFANPDVKFDQVYINSWTDTAAAKAAANAQYAAGADIIFSATDSATQGIFAAAQEGDGRYVIASYFDSNAQAPDVVLTSVLYNLDGVTKEMIRRAQAGEIEPTNYAFGLDFGVGTLAPFYGLEDVVPADAKTRLEEITRQIEDGTITVPDTEALGVQGAGGKIDTATLTAG